MATFQFWHRLIQKSYGSVTNFSKNTYFWKIMEKKINLFDLMFTCKIKFANINYLKKN